MQSRLQMYCGALAEASWLTAAIAIPLFFNISSSETFEPDKMFVLKFLAVISGAACLLKRTAAERPQKKQKESEISFKTLLKHPLVAAVIVLAAVYLLSSLISVAPSISWLGLYKRAQGTIAFYSYAILFLVVACELRSTPQLRRLQFAVILTSIPVAAYTILQHFGLDPLPWRAFYGRASGSMGNPIFLGAYLIMVMPFTIGRLVDAWRMFGVEPNRKTGIVLGCSCGLALVLQLAALLYSQSRGPIIGLSAAAYICVFLILVLRRKSAKARAGYPASAAGLGCLASVSLAAVLYFVSGAPRIIAFASLGATLVGIAIVYRVIWRTAWGRSWLWLTWLAQSVVMVVLLVAAPSRIALEHKMLSPLGRLGQLSDASTEVRQLLWQAGVQTIGSVSTPVPPGGPADAFRYLRPVFGYGPENVWFAANLHASPELARKHIGEDIDRMHNETFENLISLGFAGSALWLTVIAAAFYYSLQLLGFSAQNRDKRLFAALSALGILSGILVPWAAGAARLAGIGVIAGLLMGAVAFAAWSGFRNPPADSTIGTRQIFALCILGALIAHIVETGVGIAVTPTRLYFFVMIALLVAFSTRDLNWIEEPARQRTAKSVAKSRNPLVSLVVLSSCVVLVLSWCFVINSSSTDDALTIFLRTWFLPAGLRQGLPVPGSLILLLLVLCGSLGLIYGAYGGPRGQKLSYRKLSGFSLGAMIAVWFLMGIISAFFWTASISQSPVEVSIHTEARILVFIMGLFLSMLTMAWSLIEIDIVNPAVLIPVRGQWIGLGILTAICAFGIIRESTVHPARADIAYRIARAYESSRDTAGAIRLFDRTTDLAPRVVPYWISKGLAQASGGASSETMLQESIQSLQKALDLNPLNPSSLRTLGSIYVQAGEQSQDPAVRTAQIQRALPYFEQAVRLAPSYPDAYCDLGRCSFLLGDQQKADGLYEKALQMNPENSRTYMFLGEMHYRQNNLNRSYEDFASAARLDRRNIDARRNLGFVLTLLGRKDDAIREYLGALIRAPQDIVILRRLASLYFSQGDSIKGTEIARRAYDVTPPAQRGSFDAFAADLQK